MGLQATGTPVARAAAATPPCPAVSASAAAHARQAPAPKLKIAGKSLLRQSSQNYITIPQQRESLTARQKITPVHFFPIHFFPVVADVMVRDGARWRIDDIDYPDSRPSLRAVLASAR